MIKAKTLVLTKKELEILQYAIYLDLESVACEIASGDLDLDIEEAYDAIETLLQKIANKLHQKDV